VLLRQEKKQRLMEEERRNGRRLMYIQRVEMADLKKRK
jgi:hypothetical protein